MNPLDNTKQSETALLFGLMLSLAIMSRLFIYSFRHIPLTNVTGGGELLYALVGGVALAFSVPTLPLVVLYLTVLFASGRAPTELDVDQRVALLPAALFLLGFVSAFVITISGVPSVISWTIYEGKLIINAIGAVSVTLYGFKVFETSGLIGNLRFIRAPKGSKGITLVAPPVLGFLAGLLLFRRLDPSYDSVFFLTGERVPFPTTLSQ